MIVLRTKTGPGLALLATLSLRFPGGTCGAAFNRIRYSLPTGPWPRPDSGTQPVAALLSTHHPDRTSCTVATPDALPPALTPVDSIGHLRNRCTASSPVSGGWANRRRAGATAVTAPYRGGFEIALDCLRPREGPLGWGSASAGGEGGMLSSTKWAVGGRQDRLRSGERRDVSMDDAWQLSISTPFLHPKWVRRAVERQASSGRRVQPSVDRLRPNKRFCPWQAWQPFVGGSPDPRHERSDGASIPPPSVLVRGSSCDQIAGLALGAWPVSRDPGESGLEFIRLFRNLSRNANRSFVDHGTAEGRYLPVARGRSAAFPLDRPRRSCYVALASGRLGRGGGGAVGVRCHDAHGCRGERCVVFWVAVHTFVSITNRPPTAALRRPPCRLCGHRGPVGYRSCMHGIAAGPPLTLAPSVAFRIAQRRIRPRCAVLPLPAARPTRRTLLSQPGRPPLRPCPMGVLTASRVEVGGDLPPLTPLPFLSPLEPSPYRVPGEVISAPQCEVSRNLGRENEGPSMRRCGYSCSALGSSGARQGLGQGRDAKSGKLQWFTRSGEPQGATRVEPRAWGSYLDLPEGSFSFCWPSGCGEPPPPREAPFTRGGGRISVRTTQDPGPDGEFQPGSIFSIEADGRSHESVGVHRSPAFPGGPHPLPAARHPSRPPPSLRCRPT